MARIHSFPPRRGGVSSRHGGACQPDMGDPMVFDQVARHVERHVGPITQVFNDPKCRRWHLDALHVASPRGRPFQALVTCGVSSMAMSPPAAAGGGAAYLELVAILPSSWPLSVDQSVEPAWGWPLWTLFDLARHPREASTWLWEGHTWGAADPAEPLSSTTTMTSVILAPAVLLPPRFMTLDMPDGRHVHFYAIVPIHADELAFKRRHGARALMRLLDRVGISEMIVPDRRSVCVDPPPSAGARGPRRRPGR